MAELRIQITHVAWRDGRPRFMPGPQLRREGWTGEDLRHGPETHRPGHPARKIGPWFSAEECVAWVADREKAIAARRQQIADAKAAGRRAAKLQPAKPGAWFSIEDLFEAWQKSPRLSGGESEGKRKVKAVAPATLSDYKIKIGVLAKFDQELFVAPVDALTKPIVYDLYERLWTQRGLAMARGVIATLSSAISWGIKKGHVHLQANPCHDLGMETPDPRVRCLTPAEVKTLVAAADASGRPEIGDCIILGCWTGQRQGDRLAMVDGGTLDGRRYLKQRKTAAIVMIPDAPEVTGRLEAMRRRRATWPVQPMEIVVDEVQRRPWNRSHYSHTFADVRAAAVAGVVDKEATTRRNAELLAMHQVLPSEPVWKVAPMPSLKDARDQDLRDTAVTWLARAKCTLPEICQITGHTLQSATQTLRHYLAAHPEMADNAIEKLVKWMDAQTT